MSCADAVAASGAVAVAAPAPDASFSESNSISICSVESNLSSASVLSVLNSITAVIKCRITSILRRVFKYVSISSLAL